MKLEIQGVCAGYGGKTVLEDIRFTVPSGSITTLLGPNGCGKSTLLKVIGRTLKPFAGSVLLDGEPIGRRSTGELARVLAILPQLHHASGELSVEELTAFGRYPHRGFNPVLSPHDRATIDNALDMTRMTELRRRRISTLSGGERQRAWIAMTLAQEPKILLLDEPTTFLDICCQFEIIEMVRELNRKFGITVIMVLHDLNLAARCSNQLVLLKDRKVRYSGAPAEVMTAAVLRDVFEIEPEINTAADGTVYCLPVGSTRRRGDGNE
jgi:iron complex transport system ATP-binding protein